MLWRDPGASLDFTVPWEEEEEPGVLSLSFHYFKFPWSRAGEMWRQRLSGAAPGCTGWLEKGRLPPSRESSLVWLPEQRLPCRSPASPLSPGKGRQGLPSCWRQLFPCAVGRAEAAPVLNTTGTVRRSCCPPLVLLLPKPLSLAPVGCTGGPSSSLKWDQDRLLPSGWRSLAVQAHGCF